MFGGFFDNFRAHPFQSLLSLGAGALVPGGGFAANRAFGAWNNHNFNNAMNTSLANGAAQGDAAAQAGFDRPLNGALGAGGAYGGAAPGAPAGNYDFGGGINYTGAGTGLFDQMQNSANNGLFDFGSNNSMFVPDYGMAGDVASGVYGGAGHVNPSERRDYRAGLALNGPGVGNYGISNFMAGGQNAIFGSGDPNGRYRNRGTDFGG